jgi:hypothetical protein
LETKKSFTNELEKQGEADVRQRLQNEGLGSPGSENYTFAQEWLRGKEREREDALNTRREAREKESLSISRRAFWISVCAIIVAIASLLFSILKK